MPSGYSRYHQGGQGSKTNCLYHDPLGEGFKCYLNASNIQRIVLDKEENFLFIEFTCPKCEETISWAAQAYEGSRPTVKKGLLKKYGLKKRARCSCKLEWRLKLLATSFRQQKGGSRENGKA